jgi:hypothetical protein
MRTIDWDADRFDPIIRQKRTTAGNPRPTKGTTGSS